MRLIIYRVAYSVVFLFFAVAAYRAVTLRFLILGRSSTSSVVVSLSDEPGVFWACVGACGVIACGALVAFACTFRRALPFDEALSEDRRRRIRR